MAREAMTAMKKTQVSTNTTVGKGNMWYFDCEPKRIGARLKGVSSCRVADQYCDTTDIPQECRAIKIALTLSEYLALIHHFNSAKMENKKTLQIRPFPNRCKNPPLGQSESMKGWPFWHVKHIDGTAKTQSHAHRGTHRKAATSQLCEYPNKKKEV